MSAANANAYATTVDRRGPGVKSGENTSPNGLATSQLRNPALLDDDGDILEDVLPV
jgi:hypothetical protein